MVLQKKKERLEMIEWIVGAALLNGVMNSKAEEAADRERRKREKEIKKLKKELRELKGEEEEKGILGRVCDFIFD